MSSSLPKHREEWAMTEPSSPMINVPQSQIFSYFLSCWADWKQQWDKRNLRAQWDYFIKRPSHKLWFLALEINKQVKEDKTSCLISNVNIFSILYWTYASVTPHLQQLSCPHKRGKIYKMPLKINILFYKIIKLQINILYTKQYVEKN